MPAEWTCRCMRILRAGAFATFLRSPRAARPGGPSGGWVWDFGLWMSCPLGHGQYRTQVSVTTRLRKRLYDCGSCGYSDSCRELLRSSLFLRLMGFMRLSLAVGAGSAEA